MLDRDAANYVCRGLPNPTHDEDAARFLVVFGGLNNVQGGRDAVEGREENACSEGGTVDPPIVRVADC